MELTQDEIRVLKEMARNMLIIEASKDKELAVKQARQAVGDAYKQQLDALKGDPIARKALIEEMTIAANEAEAQIP